MLKEWFQKFMDVVMPLDPPLPEESAAVEKNAAPAPKPAEEIPQPAAREVPVKRAAAAGGISRQYAHVHTADSGTASVNGIRYTAYTDNSQPERPRVVAPMFDMKIYRPADYNQVAGITDDVLTQKAVVVNYENVNPEEQRRICDFIEGACYAVDGTVTKISDRIFLYSPAGIDASDLASLVAASARYR